MIPLALSLALSMQGPLGSFPALDAESFEAVVAHVLPSEAELEWRTIPWRPTLRQGVLDGIELERPVLLWAMNGHPLGST